MNKIQYIIGVIVAVLLTSCGSNINDELPSVSTVFIEKYFSNTNVAKVEKTLDMDYEVTLENGINITFERRGNWEEINARKNDISTTLGEILPYSLVSYVQTHYPEKKIRKVERKKYGYLVTLNKPKSVRLEFNKSGSFISKKEDE